MTRRLAVVIFRQNHRCDSRIFCQFPAARYSARVGWTPFTCVGTSQGAIHPQLPGGRGLARSIQQTTLETKGHIARVRAGLSDTGVYKRRRTPRCSDPELRVAFPLIELIQFGIESQVTCAIAPRPLLHSRGDNMSHSPEKELKWTNGDMRSQSPCEPASAWLTWSSPSLARARGGVFPHVLITAYPRSQMAIVSPQDRTVTDDPCRRDCAYFRGMGVRPPQYLAPPPTSR